MTNSPYVVVWTESWNGAGYAEYGFINIAPIAINANGMISFDPSRKYWTPAARSSFGPAVFKFNNTPYIVWTSPRGEGELINIAPIAVNANGAISIDLSRRFVLPERAVVSTVFEFNNSPYIIRTYFEGPMFIAPIAINANGYY